MMAGLSKIKQLLFFFFFCPSSSLSANSYSPWVSSTRSQSLPSQLVQPQQQQLSRSSQDRLSLSLLVLHPPLDQSPSVKPSKIAALTMASRTSLPSLTRRLSSARETFFFLYSTAAHCMTLDSFSRLSSTRPPLSTCRLPAQSSSSMMPGMSSSYHT